MSKLLIKVLCSAASIAWVLTAAQIANAQNRGPPPDTVGIVTGPADGIYLQIGRDIEEVIEEAGLNVDVKESQGSLENIRRMLSIENAPVGVVQADILGFLSSSSDANLKEVANSLRLVFPLYNEDVHLFARKEIRSVEDLEDKRVIVGNPASGHWLTATNIMSLLNVEPSENVELDPAEGITAVLTGRADAMFYVSGKPAPVFTNLEKLSKNPAFASLVSSVHLVPVTGDGLFDEYDAARIGSVDYSWMDEPVNTVSVRALLVTFNFADRNSAYYRGRCDQLETVGSAIYAARENLKQTGHPKWSEVDLDLDIGVWKKDQCAMRGLTGSASSESVDEETTRALFECIKNGDCG